MLSSISLSYLEVCIEESILHSLFASSTRRESKYSLVNIYCSNLTTREYISIMESNPRVISSKIKAKKAKRAVGIYLSKNVFPIKNDIFFLMKGLHKQTNKKRSSLLN